MSDYLSDDEQLARLRGWWEKNGLALLLAVIVAILAVIGWRWYSSQQQAGIEAASRHYETYLDATGDTRAAAFAQLEAEHAGTSYFTLALLREAADAAGKESFDQARTLLERALEQAPDPLLGDLANIRLAKVLVQLDQGDAALTALGRVRGEGYRAQVAELKGDLHMTRGEVALAHEAYTAALEATPEGQAQPVLEMKAVNTANPHGV